MHRCMFCIERPLTKGITRAHHEIRPHPWFILPDSPFHAYLWASCSYTSSVTTRLCQPPISSDPQPESSEPRTCLAIKLPSNSSFLLLADFPTPSIPSYGSSPKQPANALTADDTARELYPRTFRALTPPVNSQPRLEVPT